MLIYKNPKAKPCEVCERLFVPDRMGQLVCRPACALKKVRQAKVEERSKIKTRREKAKTTGQRKAEAQAAINKWVVHVRDKDQPCISCGRFHDGMYHAGHYRSRGSAPHLALDPRNLHKQCAPCNLHLHGNLIEYRRGLIERHGAKFVEALEADQTPRHLSPDEIDAIRDTYRAKLKEEKP